MCSEMILFYLIHLDQYQSVKNRLGACVSPRGRTIFFVCIKNNAQMPQACF